MGDKTHFWLLASPFERFAIGNLSSDVRLATIFLRCGKWTRRRNGFTTTLLLRTRCRLAPRGASAPFAEYTRVSGRSLRLSCDSRLRFAVRIGSLYTCGEPSEVHGPCREGDPSSCRLPGFTRALAMPHFAILVFFVTFFIIFFYSDASECGAGRSRRYCNTETTRGDGVASHGHVADRCKNQVNTQRGSMILDSGIKLNRTDTTLDLSQKAEKRW